jgi:hypothetical protein
VERFRLSSIGLGVARRLLLILVMLLAVLTAQTVHRSAPASAAGSPCRGSATPRWQHVVWVMMENRSFGSVIGSSAARYTNGLARSCGLATNYHALGHPSLPNYLALTSGSTHGVSNDGSPRQHPISGPSIFSQVSSRSLIESEPAPCAPHDSGAYLVQHNPQAFYTSGRAQCRVTDVALHAPPNISAAFTLIKPNAAHDMHSASTQAGDRWLRQFIPTLLATPQYRAGSTAIFIVWDESKRRAGDQVPLIAIAPSVPSGARLSSGLNHYSLLRTTEDMLGVSRLGAASSAPSMRTGFHL